jgi:maltooligosyltrehalose trehalohydrolase
MGTRTPHRIRLHTRRYPVGAELLASSVVSVRVWAPEHRQVTVVIDGRATRLERQGDGYFSGHAHGRHGSRYGFRLDEDPAILPDPASRWQPDGPEGLSAVVDLGAYRWRDHEWPGLSMSGQVLYEMHVGTYTAAGTWQGAAALLPRVRALGVTAIQMMPVAEFAGEYGWGYDGVAWFAPMHAYGEPADLQGFVDRAHAEGLGVVLDVVYNHLGPSGNVLPRYSPYYTTDRYTSEWGPALNFDGEHAGPVRDLVLSNVEYWVREFHIDGFRIDAAQQIHDASPDHLLTAIARTARAAAEPRQVIVLAEHEPQHARLVRAVSAGGYGLDGLYHEDFHHSTRVALTGIREAYLSDYAGSSREWLAAALRGFLFQGQHYPWQGAPRGAPALDRPAEQFVCFLENHDQVANCAGGRRLVELTSPAWWRAMSALLLLGPWTPMLFQGQEWASRSPFTYFANHEPSLQATVMEGRRRFLEQFARQVRTAEEAAVPGATSGADAHACCLDHDLTAEGERAWTLHRDLLDLRRRDFLGPRAALVGATLSNQVLLLRHRGDGGGQERLVVINLGPDMNLAGIAEPLLAPPEHCDWMVRWCSEDRRYGGSGVAACAPPDRLIATGHAATVFHPLERAS